MDFRVQKHEGQVTTAAAIRLRVFISFLFFVLFARMDRNLCRLSLWGAPRPSHPPSVGKSVHLFRRLFILINLPPSLPPSSVIFSGTASCGSRKKVRPLPSNQMTIAVFVLFWWCLMMFLACLFLSFFLSFYSDLSHSHKHSVSLCSSRCRGNCR